MSAATDYISKKWVDMFMTTVISLIIAIVTIKATTREANDKEREDKINNAASVKYVNQRIDEKIISHEQKEEARYKGIQDMFMITNERLKEIQADIRQIKQ